MFAYATVEHEVSGVRFTDCTITIIVLLGFLIKNKTVADHSLFCANLIAKRSFTGNL